MVVLDINGHLFLSNTEGQMRILQNVSLQHLYTAENFKPQNVFLSESEVLHKLTTLVIPVLSLVSKFTSKTICISLLSFQINNSQRHKDMNTRDCNK